MMAQLSTTDSLLVAIPMVGLLFAGFFRLDELFGKSKKKPVKTRRPMVGLDENGRPMCVDPDGQVAERKSKKN